MPEATQLVSGRARVPSLLAPSPHTVLLMPQLPVMWQSWQGRRACVGPLMMGPGIRGEVCQGDSGRRGAVRREEVATVWC